MLERRLSLVLGLVLAALLVAVSAQELLGPAPSPVFGLIASRTGIGLIEPGARYLIAALQLVAVALILPLPTRVLGAGLALAIATVAMATHLTPWLGLDLPDAARTSVLLKAGHTAAQIDAMGLATDKGAMFLLALAIAVLSTATLFLARRAQSPNAATEEMPPVEAANGAAHTPG